MFLLCMYSLKHNQVKTYKQHNVAEVPLHSFLVLSVHICLITPLSQVAAQLSIVKE